MKTYQEINQEIVDQWVEDGWEWGRPVSHETYEKAQAGCWDVQLTPTVSVPKEWFGTLEGKRVLGLASGGGQQIPIFHALGALCTVLDNSKKQIEQEHLVAQREGYRVEALVGDMTKPLPFADESFDLIFHPVSNCYVREVEPIFHEAYRVLAPGGILLSGLTTEINYLVDEKEERIIWQMPFDPLRNEAQRLELERHQDGMQFSHTISEQIGGQLKAGFILTDLYDDTNGMGRLHELNIKTYVATRAIKPSS